LIKAANYLQFDATSSDTSAVTATAGASAETGSHTIEVTQLATAETISSSTALSADITGSSEADFTSAVGESFVITVDGTDYTVTLDSSVTDVDSLQDAVDTAVGSGKVTVGTTTVDSTSVLTFTAATGSGVTSLSIADSTSNGALTNLGFASTDVTSNRITEDSTLSEISAQLGTAMTFVANSTSGDNAVTFSINGTSFTFTEDETLGDVIDAVNASDCGATLKYDELTDKLVLTADDTGAGTMLSVKDSDASTFVSSLLGGTAVEGKDAIMVYDGTKVTRSSNSIKLDGVTYKLSDVTTDEVAVDIEQDTDAVYDLVSNFVDAYNTLIESINDKLDENYDNDYLPLTEDQEDEMSDTEIEKWNAKAKTGLLEGDDTLSDLLRNFRVALMDSVSGSTLSLSEIGITSGTYDENGKLYIDEDALKAAIEDDATSVQALFAQKSTSYPTNSAVRTMSSDERNTRYDEEGIALRFYDVLSDYVSTSTDSAGNKGRLLELAGMDSDGSDTDNSLTTKITDYEERIEKEEDRLDALRERWESKFSAMEDAIEQMNSQSSYIDSLMSSDDS
jgi:flagellar hook-associated protein 2